MYISCNTDKNAFLFHNNKFMRRQQSSLNKNLLSRIDSEQAYTESKCIKKNQILSVKYPIRIKVSVECKLA